MSIVVLVGGIALLVAGANTVVRSAGAIAQMFNVSRVVVGLTVVALATSLPEALVSLNGVWSGYGDIAVGNAVGSNLFNVLFILGAVAILRPVAVNRSFLQRELPVLAIVTGGVLVACADQALSRIEGLALIAGLATYVYFLVRRASRAETPLPLERQTTTSPPKVAADLLFGFAALGAGAHFALTGAVELAAQLSISERIVGLFVLGAGSSLPELVTSIVAARRGQADLAVGNVLGSCLFNILFVIGITSTLAPAQIAISSSAFVDLAAMAVAFVIAAGFLRSGLRVSRGEGAVLVVNYAIYCVIALAVGGRLAS